MTLSPRRKLIGLVLLSVLLASAAQILMKSGMNSVALSGSLVLTSPSTWLPVFTNVHVMGGLVMIGCAFIVWLGALGRTDVSLLHPLAATGYVLTTVFAIVFLGEVVSAARWLGVALIVVGSTFVARSQVTR
jgi:drug/metabolite transporter (DMT)-like permease